MKKFMIAAIAFFAVLGIAIGSMLISASRVRRYERETDDHRRDVLTNYTKVYAVHSDDEKPDVSLSPGNTVSFLTAVTRTGLLHKYFLPKSDGETVTVTFADGAEYTVIDGGLNKNGKDVVYIIYKFDGHTYYFELSEYQTFDRVLKVTSPEGFGYDNWLLEEDAQSADDAA